MEGNGLAVILTSIAEAGMYDQSLVHIIQIERLTAEITLNATGHI